LTIATTTTTTHHHYRELQGLSEYIKSLVLIKLFAKPTNNNNTLINDGKNKQIATTDITTVRQQHIETFIDSTN